MSTPQIIGLGGLECISVLIIIRLWRKKRRMSIWSRCFWSVVLLVPLFGWLFYGFVVTDPDEHSDVLTEHWDGYGGSPPSDPH
jgi:4-amino-4-deoxy-L-arabinose transferase-like glycosyltransferase